MAGQTGLVMQGSNDIAFTNPVTVALSPAGSTSSGITTSLGIANGLFTGPIPARYIRFLPTGFTSGTQTILAYMSAIPGAMPSIGANMSGSISSWGTSVAPGISNGVNALGTSTGNLWQARFTGTADLALGTALAAVAAQIPYVTEIHSSVWGAGATPRQIRVVAAANALLEQNLVCPANDSRERIFRNPWKPMSSINNILQIAVTSIGAFVGNWEVVLAGYYQTS
jgi:hypothetical protein